jgi:hypothetical protein
MHPFVICDISPKVIGSFAGESHPCDFYVYFWGLTCLFWCRFRGASHRRLPSPPRSRSRYLPYPWWANVVVKWETLIFYYMAGSGELVIGYSCQCICIICNPWIMQLFLYYIYIFSLIVPSCFVLCFHILILCALVKVSYLFLLFSWFKSCVAWWCCWFSSRDMGETTEEEQIHSDIASWPGINMSVKPTNSSLKLYGGAASGRHAWFHCVMYSMKCPQVQSQGRR